MKIGVKYLMNNFVLLFQTKEELPDDAEMDEFELPEEMEPIFSQV